MTLLTGLGGQAWASAAAKLDLPFLRTVVVGTEGALDPYGYWHAKREIHEAGALLVRPDGYIAWRQPDAVWDDTDALHQLQDALGAVLDRPNRDESATSAIAAVQHPGRADHGPASQPHRPSR